jgi:acyl-CoA thioesterase-2
MSVPRADVSSGTLTDLLAVLDLEPAGADRFRGHSPDVTAERVFGGQVAAQAVIAAGRTVSTGRELATIQATFLRPGNPQLPIDFDVTRTADGRTFAFRQVSARQRDRTVFTLTATFHAGDAGPAHAAPTGSLDPLGIPAYRPDLAPLMTGAFDLRRMSSAPDVEAMTLALRTTAPLPDDALLHSALAVYASDLYILDAALGRHGLEGLDPIIDVFSIDHAMWFHRVPCMDEWVINRLTAPIARAGRTLVQGEMRDAHGELLASLTQHGLMRYSGVTPTSRG